MEKLRIEVSTHSAICSSLAPGFCAVCGLILSAQAFVSAAESPRPIAKPTLRPMAVRHTTTAKSSAKTQVSKARSTPLQLLQPKANSSTARIAMTDLAPSVAERNEEDSLDRILPPAKGTRTEIARAKVEEKTSESKNIESETVVLPDDRIVMTALPESTPTERIPVAIEEKSEPLKTVQLENAPVTVENTDETNDGAMEPLTGSFNVETKSVQSNSAAPTSSAQISSAQTSKPAGSTPGDATVVTADSKTNQTSTLYAPRISYENGSIIAEGTEAEPVRLEGPGTRIIARKVRLDTKARIVRAEGQVRVERQITASRFSTFSPDQAGGNDKTETVTETLQGENFEYNYGTRQGKLDTTRVRLANLNISAAEIIINGTKYIARNVVIRPGGLSDEEIKIYGTPPLSIRARQVTIDTSELAPEKSGSSDTPETMAASGRPAPRTQVQGAALYIKNFRLFPIPSALLGRSFGGAREQETYQLTPRISFNSADGLLVTVGLDYPFSAERPGRLALETDIGLSTRVGFRGGATLSSNNKLGRFSLGARINDVISSQLTNRIELDRLPEFAYRPPRLILFDLPGGRRAGLVFDFSAGDYRERFTTGGGRTVSSSRLQSQVRFTTRLGEDTGPYLDLTGRTASYSDNDENLSTAGFEVGYIGQLGSRLTGQFSFGATKVNGSTPFEFDKVPITKELRATFDILITPRYIIPIDLRYDLDRKELREKTFGLLRNYKTFAYGFSYQASRQELQFQVRQGF